MYKVYKRESKTFPKETFTVFYEVDFDGENAEWRKCVKDIIDRLSVEYKITEVDVPEFFEGEDFVELKYSIDNESLEFSCDFLLYSIYITTSSIPITEKLRDTLGYQVGWEQSWTSALTRPSKIAHKRPWAGLASLALYGGVMRWREYERIF
jgi:hypothetical protein